MRRAVPIAGREQQNMVVVDFSNPFLRDYFPKWLKNHGAHLAHIRAELPDWAEESRQAELRDGGARPLAAVFDIDEVLLCNTHLNGYTGVQGGRAIDFHAADFFTDDATGKPWGREDPGDPPLPGALELLMAVRDLSIQPFFITGRYESIRDITVEDFRRAGFCGEDGHPVACSALDADAETILIMRPDETRPAAGDAPPSLRVFKEAERASIEKKYRIVLNVGDQASDLGLHGDRQYLTPHAFYHTY